MPVTTPAALTLATDALLVLQVPPVAEPVSVAGVPMQIVVGPDIVPADGVSITVMALVSMAVPQLLVTA